ncbi:unnamed protein product [Adineta steineri]|uniref:Cilia- and flagella-associated protein 251 n=1 Tax=Adineta steineri TaxID=433720 RepID=A0A814FW38_9BILA|nr:unnamed protein product [Adineta steineri]
MSFAPPPDAPPYPATPDQENQDEETSTAAYAEILSFQWCFGFNKDLPVLNLSINKTKKIFFVSAQIGVMYDFANNRQQLLIGHRNNITSCCVSHDKRWLCTADSGRDCTIIIWDTITGLPNQTYFDVLNGTGTVAFSTDAKYLATLSQQSPQIISIWDWTAENDKPLCALELKREYSNQHYLQFNPLITTVHRIQDNAVTQLRYNHSANYIAVGYADGKLTICDALSLESVLQAPFHYAKAAIHLIEFSNTSDYLATAEEDFTISVYRQNLNSEEIYTFLGRYRAHYKPIRALFFGFTIDDNQPILTAVGADRILAEYDLNESEIDHLVLKPSTRIEQIAEPMSACYYPASLTQESFLVTVNNEYKYKLYNADTKMCRKTILGPTFGSPIRKIGILPKLDENSNEEYVYFMTTDKIGLQRLPLTGNPFDQMAIIAHPNRVSDIRASYDGKYLFTSGGLDNCVHMLSVNPQVLQAQAQLGGKDLIPFYKLLEGGREGEIFREMQELFYYSQLRYQDIHRFDRREISAKIPLSEIPFVMRALGYYPTEQEIEEMINEVKFSTYIDTKTYVEDIDLNDFIKLYINHRPAFGLNPADLTHAFNVLSDQLNSNNGQPEIYRENLLCLLQQYGEHINDYEMAEFNNEYKYKLYNADTKMCRKTILGPTFGSPIRKIGILPKLDENSNKEYVYFMTTDKIGLQRLPLTGNPFDQMAIIAHPNRVSDIRASYDGKYLFTSGGLDNCVHMLSVNPQVLQAQAQLGGKDLIPFYKLLEGGREGEIFREMQELFYYSQLRYQDIHRFDRREISAKIPLSEIPFVMRALGYYPTEQEIEEMINEVKFSTYIDTKTYVEDIDLNDFIKLYINHRPAFGLNPADLTHAFNVLSDQLNSNNGQPEIYRENLLCLLQQYGEHINDYEMAECLANLLNLNHETTEMFDTMNATKNKSIKLKNKRE